MTVDPKTHWRSLSELENTPEFQDFLQREFPSAASELPQGLSRRRWLQLMGASFALATVAGCRWETERIAPFVDRPDNRIPGEPQKYATSIELAGGVRHLLVTNYDGRPIKVEGNPEHPACQGASDAFAQATILDLYDPDRSSSLRQRIGVQPFRRDWTDFEQWSRQHFSVLKRSAGETLRVLVEPTASPTFVDMLNRLRSSFPQARIFEYSSVSRENEHAGSKMAFGQVLRKQLALDMAKVIVCLDDDLLGQHPAALHYTREYADRRSPDGEWMNRLYVVESQYSTTGAAADHRLAIKSSDMGRFLSELEAEIARRRSNTVAEGGSDKRQRVVQAIADDLLANQGQSVVTAGPQQPADIHARVARLNAELENVGQTISYLNSVHDPLEFGDLQSLVSEIDRGEVETLLILGGNPVYTSPVDIDFKDALTRVKHAIHLSRYEDETSRSCEWHLPQAHPFEAWGDLRGFDGTYSVSQPLIDPLLNGKSAIEVLALLSGDDVRDGEAIVRRSMARALGSKLSERAWRRMLHDGYLQNTSFAAVVPTVRQFEAEKPRECGLEVVFRASDTVYDGSFANNGWLQETPDSLTKLTWDNAAILSPRTAKRLNVEHGTSIDLELRGRQIRLPAFVLPGQADDSIGVALGYGRTAAGYVGGSVEQGVPAVGVDVNAVRHFDAMHLAADVIVRPTGKPYPLATTQDHHAIDAVGLEEIGRRVGQLVREGTLEEYKNHPDFAQHRTHHPPLESLWQEPSYDGHAWGMSIDLNKCIGCNACMVACQAENNVPIVGKDQVLRGREMHWIRTDRYFTGDVDDPQVTHQPVACHHCENAPCEQVCPVAATVHSDEGLNDMVYNRCVGTRYCANNCPYKVRRFNFFDYNAGLEEPGRDLVQLAVNPEVTVRSRGVMEKCTYCVQRIQRVKIDAKNDARPIRDGEIMTACQQACPAQAIEFGDLNDENSRVAKAHVNPRGYGMLAELNVKPRTKYLARIRNPHPLLHESDKHTGFNEDVPHDHHS